MGMARQGGQAFQGFPHGAAVGMVADVRAAQNDGPRAVLQRGGDLIQAVRVGSAVRLRRPGPRAPNFRHWVASTQHASNQGLHQSQFGAGPVREMHFRPRRGFRAHGMQREQAHPPAADGPFEMHVQHGNFFARVYAEQHRRVRMGLGPGLRLHQMRQGRHAGEAGLDVAALTEIDVVRLQAQTRPFLQQIIALVAQFGAADGAHRRVAARLLHGREALGHEGQRFVPRDGGQFLLPAPAYQRPRQTIRMLSPVVAEAILVRDELIVDGHVLAAQNAPHFGAVARVHADVVAHGVVEADGGRALHLPRPVLETGRAVGQRPDRADVDDVAAGLGVHARAGLDVDDGVAAALEQAQLRFLFPFLQVTHAAPTDDATLLVQDDGVGDRVIFGGPAFRFHQLADAGAEAHGHVLQGTFAAFVADGAIQRMVQQNEAQVGLLGRLDGRGVRTHHHAVRHGRIAGRVQHRAAGAVELHQALAATGDRIQFGMAAENRDFNAQAGGHVNQQRAAGRFHFPFVDGQTDVVVGLGHASKSCGSTAVKQPAFRRRPAR